MLGFVKKLFAPQGNPIGVDLGGSALRMAQLDLTGDSPRLVHAAAEPMLGDATAHIDDYLGQLSSQLRRMLSGGQFMGRQAVVGLPNWLVHIQHVRVPKCEGAELRAAVQQALLEKLPVEPSACVIRQTVAGDIYSDSSPQQEVIAMAIEQRRLKSITDALASARLDLVGLCVQPRIMVDCFASLFVRKVDEDAVTLFVDLGATGTRATIVTERQLIRFARQIPRSAAQIHRDVAMEMGLTVEDSLDQLARVPDSALQGSLPVEADSQVARLIAATRRLTVPLADELEACRRYYEATFNDYPISRIVFCGGGARDRIVCQALAQALALPAQVGDPFLRMNRSELPALGCIDRRFAQPNWIAAIGMSLTHQALAA
jgi:type IV pilus assembly protein PilM